jgi:hypothetical protein
MSKHPIEQCASKRIHEPHAFKWERSLSLLGPIVMTYDCPGVDGTLCEWWARCEYPATTTRRHPILGDVPICERCTRKLQRIESER